MSPAPPTTAPAPTPTDRRSVALRGLLQETQELQGLLSRAHEARDYAAYNDHVRRLRELLRDHPTAWRLTGDLARKTAYKVVRIAADDPHEQESMLAGMERLRADLGYERSPPLERVLIDRVALAWVNAEVAAHCSASLAYEGGREPKHAPFWEKRVEAAERRLQQAVESLARTRKLVRSTKLVQINYAHQQVVHNAAGVAAEPSRAIPAAPTPEEEPSRELAGPAAVGSAASALPPGGHAPGETTREADVEASNVAEPVPGCEGGGRRDAERHEPAYDPGPDSTPGVRTPAEDRGAEDAWSDDEVEEAEGFDDEEFDDDDDYFDFFATPKDPVKEWVSTLPSQLFRVTPDEVPPGHQEARLAPDEIGAPVSETERSGHPGDASVIGGWVAGFLDEMDRACGPSPKRGTTGEG